MLWAEKSAAGSVHLFRVIRCHHAIPPALITLSSPSPPSLWRRRQREVDSEPHALHRQNAHPYPHTDPHPHAHCGRCRCSWRGYRAAGGDARAGDGHRDSRARRRAHALRPRRGAALPGSPRPLARSVQPPTCQLYPAPSFTSLHRPPSHAPRPPVPQRGPQPLSPRSDAGRR